MAMRVNTSTPVSKRNPHVAKIKSQQKLLPTVLGSKPWDGKYLIPTNSVSTPLTFDNVVSIESNAVASIDAVPITSDGHVQEDDSVALEAWLEAYSLPQYAANEIIAPARKEARIRKNGKIKLIDVNKVMACWLMPGDTWGKGDRPDPEYPTRTEYKRREGLSQYTRRRDGHSLRKVVDNGPWYKGPHWTASMSKFKQPLGFEKWSRPPTVTDVIATHWACLASHSDYDYEEVHIQTRKKIEGKKYHDWPLGECTVINWKIRNASWWGPTLTESTFKGAENLLVPKHVSRPVVVAEQRRAFSEDIPAAANDPVVKDIAAQDFTYYATKYPPEFSKNILESFALMNMGKRAHSLETSLLNVKVSSRVIDTSMDKWNYNKWLQNHSTRRTQSLAWYEYKMSRFFKGMQARNSMHGQRRIYTLSISQKLIDKMLVGYRIYTPATSYFSTPYTASPPVYRLFPHPSKVLKDEIRYDLWWRAIKATEGIPPDFMFRSDPINTVTRIPAKLVNYLCQPKLQITVGKYEEPLLLAFKPVPSAKVTYSQQVLLGEVKARSQNRLSREYEWIELPLVKAVEVQTSKPRIKKEFKEQMLDLAQLDEKLDTALPADIRDFLCDSAFTPGVLAHMKGADALSAKIAKQNDLLLGGFKLDTDTGLMLPMKRGVISPQEMHSMLHGDQEFGRKRGRLARLVDSVDDFLFGAPLD